MYANLLLIAIVLVALLCAQTTQACTCTGCPLLSKLVCVSLSCTGHRRDRAASRCRAAARALHRINIWAILLLWLYSLWHARMCVCQLIQTTGLNTACKLQGGKEALAAIDRAEAKGDYDVNRKAELEIELLHQKFDLLREREFAELIAIIGKLEARIEALTAKG